MDANGNPDARPVLDPEPIPDVVLHPGDTIAYGVYSGDRSLSYVRILDRHGVCCAVLDCERDVAGHGWLIHAIRSVERGRVLPVRPQPEPKPQPRADGDGVVRTYDNNSITITAPPGTYLGDPPITHTPTPTIGSRPVVTISHEHEHPHTRDDDALAYAYRHAHPHAHTGTDGAIWFSDHVREAHDHPHTAVRDHDHDHPDDC